MKILPSGRYAIGMLYFVSIAAAVSIEESCTVDNPEGAAGTVGLSISGGGVVASTYGAAIMRGFQQQTVSIDGETRPSMEAFDYIAGLSGGNIPTVLYAFAQSMNASELLDADEPFTEPQDITTRKLRHVNRNSMFDLFSKRLWVQVVYLPIAKLWKVKEKSIWPLLVWHAMLKPVGIKRNQFFGPGLSWARLADNFVAPREEVRATPMVNFAMTGPYELFPEFTVGKSNSDYNNFFSLEEVETALSKNNNVTAVVYTATPSEVGTLYPRNMSFEGFANKAEPLAFPMSPSNPWEWGVYKKKRFSLELLLGMGTNLLPFFLGKPNATQIRKVDVGNGEERKLTFSDGGVNIGDGIANLVQKQVRKIVHVYVPMTGNKYSAAYYNGTDLGSWLHLAGLNQFAFYFGISGGRSGIGGVRSTEYHMNAIFDDGVAQMEKLKGNLNSLFEEQNPLVTTLENLTVIDNPFWGTVAGRKVDLTIIILNLPYKFSSKVPRETAPPPRGISDMVDKNELNGPFTNKELKDLPEFHVVSIEKGVAAGLLSRGFRVFGLTVKQAKMMAYLGSWIVNEAWEKPLLGHDGEVKFGGFKAILDGKPVLCKA